MLPKLGGMLRYGIPNYRLPKDRLDDDINAILKTGVEVKYGLKIGVDITIQELQEQYDAVLITIGASTDKKLDFRVRTRTAFSRSTVPAECRKRRDHRPDRKGSRCHRRRKRVHGCSPHGKTTWSEESQHFI